MELRKEKLENKLCSIYPLNEKICPYCGQSSKTVFVHGHEQCIFCNINVEPCCQGKLPKSS